MHELIVSLTVGLLANALWYVVEKVVESVRTRKNPPSDSDEG